MHVENRELLQVIVYINEKKISRVQNIKLMINNIIIHDDRFDIRQWAQDPQIHVGPFHNCIRFLHCLISLSSVFHKYGDKYDRLFFPWRIVLNRVIKSRY